MNRLQVAFFITMAWLLNLLARALNAFNRRRGG